jgi:apolipoprotein N-acyltransferase
MAVYPATWVWICWRSCPSQVAGTPSADWRTLAEALHSSRWSVRVAWTLAGAAAWVAMEILSSRLFSGFPWNLLGVSQYRLTPLIQIASATGVWGVSFLVVWFSLSLLGVAAAVVCKPALRSAWVPEITLPFVSIAVAFGIGYRQATSAGPSKRTLKVMLVQPAIPQTIIWDRNENARRFEALLQLTRQALTNKPDLLIWPEAAVPKLLRFDAPTAQAVSDLARTHHVWLILQADDTSPGTAPNAADEDYFNGAFLITPEGELAATYHKQRLVIFGEYIPFVRWLPFLKRLVPVEDYESGRQPVTFAMPSLGARTSVLICFEDAFPQVARAAVDEDTDFLVNLTNDGWFGESAEQWQQAAAAVFRAVENRVPLLRCTNNGLTCWIDEFGRIRELFDSPSRGVYGEGFLACSLEFADRAARGTPTFYRRHGDWFAWLCLALTTARLIVTGARRSALR